MKPLYLFSLPRSGSTLTQRLLSSHPEIATTYEPSFLLACLYALRNRGVMAKYDHQVLAVQLDDFCQQLPHGVNDYLGEVREFALGLYALAAGRDCTYFLDKTPRYHLIVSDIMRIFEQSKFIFLWRNPLAIASSIMNSWGNGRWNLHDCAIDLFDGLANLVATYEANRDRALAIKYEDIVAQPEPTLRRMFDYLELSFKPEVISTFATIEMRTRLEDSNNYPDLSSEPVGKWLSTMANPLRKAWSRRYLNWLGERRLAVMGYDKADLLAELEAVPKSWKMTASDAFWGSRGYARLMARNFIFRSSRRPALVRLLVGGPQEYQS